MVVRRTGGVRAERRESRRGLGARPAVESQSEAGQLGVNGREGGGWRQAQARWG